MLFGKRDKDRVQNSTSRKGLPCLHKPGICLEHIRHVTGLHARVVGILLNHILKSP